MNISKEITAMNTVIDCKIAMDEWMSRPHLIHPVRRNEDGVFEHSEENHADYYKFLSDCNLIDDKEAYCYFFMKLERVMDANEDTYFEAAYGLYVDDINYEVMFEDYLVSEYNEEKVLHRAELIRAPQSEDCQNIFMQQAVVRNEAIHNRSNKLQTIRCNNDKAGCVNKKCSYGHLYKNPKLIPLEAVLCWFDEKGCKNETCNYGHLNKEPKFLPQRWDI